MASGSGQNVLSKIRKQTLDKLTNLRSQRDDLTSLIDKIVLPAEHAAEELLQATDKKSLLKILESRNQIIQHATDQLEILSTKLTLDCDSSSEDDDASQTGSSARMSSLSVPDLVPLAPPPPADVTFIPPPEIPTHPTQVHILDPSSPSEFYVKLVHTNANNISFEMEQLQATKAPLSPSVLTVDHYYAVRHSGTDTWCRGQVKSLDGDTVDVLFVDYGTMEVISSFEAFTTLPKAVARIPAVAIECQLKDVAPLVGENWSLAALSRFSELLLTSRAITATFSDNDTHGKHLVSLQVTGNAPVPENVCLASLLVREKLARPLSDTLERPDSVRSGSIQYIPTSSHSVSRGSSLSPHFSPSVPASTSNQELVSSSGVAAGLITPEYPTSNASTKLDDIFDDWDEYQARISHPSRGSTENAPPTNPHSDSSPMISMEIDNHEEISYGGTEFLSVAPPQKPETDHANLVGWQGVRPKVRPNSSTFRPPRNRNPISSHVNHGSQEKQVICETVRPCLNSTNSEDSESFISAQSEEFHERDWELSDAFNMKDEPSAYVWDAHLLSMVLEFPKDSAMLVKLSYIESPTHFYIHPVTNVTGQLDDLLCALQYLYQDSEVPLELVISPEETVSTGRFLAAKWADDGHWYRCTVVATECDNGEYFATVLFVDYGNSARVPFTDLRPLHKALVSLPRLARLARLAEVFPLNTTFRDEEEEFKAADWPYDATALFLDLTGYDETFSAIILPKSRPVTWPLELVLVDKDENVVNSQMVVMGVARSDSFGKTVFDEERPQLKISECESELQLGAEFSSIDSAGPENEDFEPKIEMEKEDMMEKMFGPKDEEMLAYWDPMMEDYKSALNNYHFDSENIDSVLTGIIPTDDARLCRFFRASGKCFKGNKCVFEHTFTGNAPYTLDRVEVLPEPPLLDLPAAGSWVTVNIVLFHSAKSFSVNLVPADVESFEETFESLDDAIQKEYARTVVGTVANPSPGETVIAKWRKDSRFYRAKIKEQSQEDEDVYIVAFADFGNEDTVHLRDMRQPDRRFMHLPFQAVRCCLHGIETDTDSPEAVQYLTSFIENKYTEIRVHSKVNQDLYVELFTATYDDEEKPSVCVNKLIVEKGFARTVENSLESCHGKNPVTFMEGMRVPG